MSVRRIVAQQLGSILKLPFADLDHLDEPIGGARLNGVDLIVLNPYTKDAAMFEPVRGECRNVADDGFKCSKCGGFWCGPRDSSYPNLWGFRYCPTCGAKVVDA